MCTGHERKPETKREEVIVKTSMQHSREFFHHDPFFLFLFSLPLSFFCHIPWNKSLRRAFSENSSLFFLLNEPTVNIGRGIFLEAMLFLALSDCNETYMCICIDEPNVYSPDETRDLRMCHKNKKLTDRKRHARTNNMERVKKIRYSDGIPKRRNP